MPLMLENPKETIIFYDLDGTLIPGSDAAMGDPFHRYLHRHTASHLTLEDFLAENERLCAHHQTASSIEAWRRHHGKDSTWAYNHFRDVAPELAAAVIDAVTEDDALNTLLDEQLSLGYTLGLITQSFSSYRNVVMDHAKLLPFFNPEYMFGQDELNAVKTNPQAYTIPMQAVGHRFRHHHMVENIAINLHQARLHNFGTWLTNTDLPEDVSYVDYHHETIHDTCRAINQRARAQA